MFGGHNDNAAPADDSATVTPPAGTTLPAPAGDDTTTAAPGYDSNGFLTTDPAATSTGAAEPAADTTDPTAVTTPTLEPSTDDTSSTTAEAPGAPPTDTPVDSTTTTTSTTSVFSADSPVEPIVAPVAPAADNDELLNIKQQALQQLSPLVGHLDQSPEEKFRTTMMMIQAADDQTLIKDAYAAAQQITDEKTKAQALLDIVNEINYFSQNHDTPPVA